MAHELLLEIGIAILMAMLLTAISNIGNAFACRLVQIPVEKVVLFHGKPLVVLPTHLAPIQIGFIPLGGYVQMNMKEFPKKTLHARCLVLLAGPLSTFIVALLCLGLFHSVASFVATYPEFFKSIWSPLLFGKPLVVSYLNHAATSPFSGCGMLAAKTAALSFLPMPATQGGQLLMQFGGKGTAKTVAGLGNLLAAAIFLSIAAAAVGHLFHRH